MMTNSVCDDIATDFSALDEARSWPTAAARSRPPLNEAAIAEKKSRMEQYLERYIGAGAERLALAADDILATIRERLARTTAWNIDEPDSCYKDSDCEPAWARYGCR